MFGFSLKEKSEKVIEELFLYAVSPMKRPVFNNVVHNGKITSQNEYSVAFFYMMVMMNTLIAPYDTDDGTIEPSENRDEKEEKEIQDFIEGHATTILNNIHLANSPESEIKEMLAEICTRAGLIETNEVETHSKDEEDGDESTNPILEKLMEGLEIYKNILKINMSFANNTDGYKYVSEYQVKFIFGLQYLGIADCLGQAQGANDITVMAAFVAKAADAHSEEPIFGWTHVEAGEMFKKMTEVQQEEWAMKIIINGGQSVSKTISDDNKNVLPLLDIFDDVDLMKEVAAKVLP
jgi:hypothetical protein